MTADMCAAESVDDRAFLHDEHVAWSRLARAQRRLVVGLQEAAVHYGALMPSFRRESPAAATEGSTIVPTASIAMPPPVSREPAPSLRISHVPYGTGSISAIGGTMSGVASRG